MQEPGKEKRRDKRIERPCIIRFRQIKPMVSPVQWDVTTVRDMSKSGVLFYSSHYFKPGYELEINLKTPLLKGEISFHAIVIRCRPISGIKGNYETAVSTSKIDEGMLATLDKTIEFFIRKKRQESV
ncbi:MAG: PilZ domain-containing protein [Candidatus Omnitrophota bacterium]|nr:MAG: PilZ domain-containing protein [Candidatus Omnitrophota bacterium]